VRQMIVGAEEAQRIRQLSGKLAVAPNVSARGAASGRG